MLSMSQALLRAEACLEPHTVCLRLLLPLPLHLPPGNRQRGRLLSGRCMQQAQPQRLGGLLRGVLGSPRPTLRLPLEQLLAQLQAPRPRIRALGFCVQAQLRQLSRFLLVLHRWSLMPQGLASTLFPPRQLLRRCQLMQLPPLQL